MTKSQKLDQAIADLQSLADSLIPTPEQNAEAMLRIQKERMEFLARRRERDARWNTKR